MSIRVEQLIKKYDEQYALNRISFEAGKGRILGFLGPNGAGKTTTMKIAVGSLAPDEGQVFIGGEEMNVRNVDLRRRIGYLPEHNPLYLDMYVLEFLYFMAAIHQISNTKKRVAEVIDQVGLQEEQHKKINQLSKGYRQRIGLAQAILHDPDVLILDEPTSGLDPNQLIEVRGLIKRLGQDKTVLLSTHIMQEVEAICDDVVIIRKGEVVADLALVDFSKCFPGETLEQVFTRLTCNSLPAV